MEDLFLLLKIYQILINAQYETTKININNMNYEEKENQTLNTNLDILKNYTIDFYFKAN